MFLDANAVRHAERLFLREYRSSGISLPHSIIPVLVISRQFEVELPRLHLCLLDAEDIGVRLFKKVKKSFLDASPDSVDIP